MPELSTLEKARVEYAKKIERQYQIIQEIDTINADLLNGKWVLGARNRLQKLRKESAKITAWREKEAKATTLRGDAMRDLQHENALRLFRLQNYSPQVMKLIKELGEQQKKEIAMEIAIMRLQVKQGREIGGVGNFPNIRSDDWGKKYDQYKKEGLIKLGGCN